MAAAASAPPAKRARPNAFSTLGGCLGGGLPFEVEKAIFSRLTLKERIALSRANRQCQQTTFEEDGTWNALVASAERLTNEESRRALWFIWSNWPRQQRTIENKNTGRQTIITPSVTDAASALFLGEANPPVTTEIDLIAFITAELLLDEEFLREAVGENWKIALAMWDSEAPLRDEHALGRPGHYTVGVKYMGSNFSQGTSGIEIWLDNKNVSKTGIDRFPSAAIVRAVADDDIWDKMTASLPEAYLVFPRKTSMLVFAQCRTAALPLALRVTNPTPRKQHELDTENGGLSRNVESIEFKTCPGVTERYGVRLHQRDVAIGMRMPRGIFAMTMRPAQDATDEKVKAYIDYLAERRKPHPGAVLAPTVAPTARLREGLTVPPLRIRGGGSAGAGAGAGTGTGTGTVLVRRRPPPPPVVEGRVVGSLPGARSGRNLVREYATRK
jgi:hypothetical protein